MRRLTILAALLTLLGGFGVAAPPPSADAREGGPGDYCTQAPDYPLGWQFNDACRGHDECLDALPRAASLADRLDCDEAFLHDLLEAPHVVAPLACEEHLFCRVMAAVYYRVVRTATVLSGFFAWSPGSTGLPAP